MPQKIPKIDTTLMSFYVDTRIFLKQQEATDIISSPKVARSLAKPLSLLYEPLVCEKLIPKPPPNGTIFLPQHVDAAP